MPENKVTRLRIGDSSIGVIGLQRVMQAMASQPEGRADEELRDELLRRMGEKNYIPDKAKAAYGEAFLREFKRFLGKPVVGEGLQELDIRVLGPGCVQCDRLERELMEAMAETGITADVEHVRDIGEIGRYGVMGTPALVINGRVKAVGRVPARRQLAAWLEEAGSGP